MKKPYHQALWRRVGQACADYNMIEENDKIAVGLSGGKDSITLLYILARIQKISKVNFELVGVHVGMGWEVDLSPLKNFCQKEQITFYSENAQIAKIVFDARAEKNPCSLCAKLRRGALNNIAKQLNCNKVALGHHLDDAIETLLLCMFYEGRFSCFKPKTYLDRKDITVIRPLVYVKEQTIKQVVEDLQLPIIHNPCPVDGLTKREEIKNTITQLERDIPQIRDRLLSVLQNVDLQQLWKQK